MPSATAKSGPSGITIMKSRMLTNDTAASSKMILRSEAGVATAAAEVMEGCTTPALPHHRVTPGDRDPNGRSAPEVASRTGAGQAPSRQAQGPLARAGAVRGRRARTGTPGRDTGGRHEK